MPQTIITKKKVSIWFTIASVFFEYLDVFLRWLLAGAGFAVGFILMINIIRLWTGN